MSKRMLWVGAAAVLIACGGKGIDPIAGPEPSDEVEPVPVPDVTPPRRGGGGAGSDIVIVTPAPEPPKPEAPKAEEPKPDAPKPPATCTPEASVSIKDGSFESGTCGGAWVSGDLSKPTSVGESSIPRCGAHSCRVCGKGFFEIGVVQPSPAAGIHRLNAWLRAAGDAPAPYMCWAGISAANGSAGGNAVKPSTSWAMTKVEFNVPSGATEIRYDVTCQAVGDQEACVLVDDIVDAFDQ